MITFKNEKKKSEIMISSTFFVVSICLFLVSATSADDIRKVDSYTALPVSHQSDRRRQKTATSPKLMQHARDATPDRRAVVRS
uniref:Uncharacterized protein n=1 Tax=Ixodes ricinus TaxID=34613 RepID=A0A6B0U7E1_IXORI